MTIVGYGLFAVAAAIVFASLMLHWDVVKVYYPKKVDRVQQRLNMVRQAVQEGKLSEAEQWMDMEDQREQERKYSRDKDLLGGTLP